MSDGNGYDALGEDLALGLRIDRVRDTAVSANDTANAAHSYAARVEGEVITATSKLEQTVHRLGTAVNDLTHSNETRWGGFLGSEAARAVALERLKATVMDIRADQAAVLEEVSASSAAVIELRKDFKVGMGVIQKQLAEILKLQRGRK